MAVSTFLKVSKGLGFAFSGVLLGAAGVLSAHASIGTLQFDQEVSVTAPGSKTAVEVASSGYAVQSGDLITTGSGSAVIAASAGSGLGMGPDSSARIERDETGALRVYLKAGTLMYSLAANQALVVSSGDFTISTFDPAFSRINVSNASSHGMVQRLDGGQVRVAVRDGEAVVKAASGHAYPVAAGQQRGFRVSAANELQVQDAEVIQLLVDIQSPEQVRVNEEFNIRWSIGDELREGDFVTIAPVGAPEDEFEAVASTSVGQVLEFEAPGSPGDYEIRYIDGETGEIRSFVYLEVIRDRVVAYWWRDPRWIGGLAAVTGGAIYLATRDDSDDDDDPAPVSP